MCFVCVRGNLTTSSLVFLQKSYKVCYINVYELSIYVYALHVHLKYFSGDAGRVEGNWSILRTQISEERRYFGG